MKLKPVALTAYNLLRRRPRDNFEGTARPINKSLSQRCSVANFPLVHQNQFVGENDNVYRQLLQAVSSSSSNWEILDPISPDIINKLDKSQGAAPIHYACINGNLPMLELLVKSGADVNMWDAGERVTPLMCAAAHGHLDIIKVLLQHGCNIDAGLDGGNQGQHSALLWAVRGNKPKVVQCLLNNHSSQYSQVAFSETPVHASIIIGSPEILGMLISAQNNATKADFQMDSERNTPLQLAASGSHKNCFEMCKILLENGKAYVNSVNAKKQTPLHGAIAAKNEKIVKLLLLHRARLNSADVHGRTPLFYAISEDKQALACMKALIDSGNCNVNHQDNLGNTPLHLAGMLSAKAAAELLLKSGADFSIKAGGGISALSILRKNIPTTGTLLRKTFDQAVAVTNTQIGDGKTGQEQECEIEVDFQYVLPSTPNNAHFLAFQEKVKKNQSPFYACVCSIQKLFQCDNDNHHPNVLKRKETSKIKCLVKEQYSSLLLHPVIHSFLELKWHHARFFFLPTLFFKILLVLSFTMFLYTPYGLVLVEDETEGMSMQMGENLNSSSLMYDERGGNATTIENNETNLKILKIVYVPIAAMAIINAFLELSEIVRAPLQLLKTLHPWISMAVWYMIYDSRPESWEKACDPYRKSVAALGILLAWIDVWIDMSRFPKIGLSIRVFIQVLKNFLLFILPHVCLFIGFIFSLSLLFTEKSTEYQSATLTLAKLICVMAGDITIPTYVSNLTLDVESTDEQIFHYHLVVYIYTSYVLIVAIVLMNLLIGLAVNDIQGIFADASVDKLVKQTILLNTLETSFNVRWIRICSLNGCFSKYINLFPSDSTDKTKTFNPYDSNNSELNSEHMKALLKIGNMKTEKEERSKSRNFTSSISKRFYRRNAFVNKLKSRSCSEDEERVLLENIDKLKVVLSYFENKIPSQ